MYRLSRAFFSGVSLLLAALVAPTVQAQQPLSADDPDWDELRPENHQPQLTPATGAR
jgi:hypothetical protein